MKIFLAIVAINILFLAAVKVRKAYRKAKIENKRLKAKL